MGAGAAASAAVAGMTGGLILHRCACCSKRDVVCHTLAAQSLGIVDNTERNGRVLQLAEWVQAR